MSETRTYIGSSRPSIAPTSRTAIAPAATASRGRRRRSSGARPRRATSPDSASCLTLADCDTKLERYRAALEAGIDPAVVSRWIREVTELREQARREMRVETPAHKSSSEDELRRLVEGAGDTARALAGADPKRKSQLYASLGLDLVYLHANKRVMVEAGFAVCQDRCRRPDTNHNHTNPRAGRAHSRSLNNGS